MNPDDSPHATALLLPGGGARVAYQVGVLRGLATILADHGGNPFPILCGTSAGAINAVGLAAMADDFLHATQRLESLWRDLTVSQVYRSGWFATAWNGLRLLASLVNAGIAVGRPVALLDNTPLRETLTRAIDFDAIGRHLDAGQLQALCVTAMNYTQGTSTSFFQGGPAHAGWQRWRRQGVPSPLNIHHLMASTAIPTLFPPERIGEHYFGDGALRQLTPVSPALHLGAGRVLVVSASGHRRSYARPIRKIQSPAFGQIIGHLLNSALIDSLETDIELLERVNELLWCMPEAQQCRLARVLRPVDLLVISPTRDIDTIADAHVHELPASMRAFLSATGSSRARGGVNIASYLLFTRPYIGELIELGYSDALAMADEVKRFLELPTPSLTTA
jgi:NTE family protein